MRANTNATGAHEIHASRTVSRHSLASSSSPPSGRSPSLSFVLPFGTFQFFSLSSSCSPSSSLCLLSSCSLFFSFMLIDHHLLFDSPLSLSLSLLHSSSSRQNFPSFSLSSALPTRIPGLSRQPPSPSRFFSFPLRPVFIPDADQLVANKRNLPRATLVASISLPSAG